MAFWIEQVEGQGESVRRQAKVDANQAEIVRALRLAGATVQILSAVGDGCPDLLVGHYGSNVLMEIKDSNQPPSKRKLTPDEHTWHQNWRGTAYTVETVEEALQLIGRRRL